MLQSTATAYAKVRAPRHDTIRRRLEDLQQLGFVMLPVMAGTPEADALAGQGPGHESRLPLPHYSLRVVRKSCNGCDFFGAADDSPRSAAQASPSCAGVRPLAVAPGHPSTGCPCVACDAPQACRNSAKCGSLPARNSAFTRSTSSA